MQKTRSIVLNLIFFLQVLTTFLFFIQDKIQLPGWLQMTGRFHPLILHLPIGFLILFVLLVIFRSLTKLDPGTFNTILYIILILTSLMMSFTTLCGFFLSLENNYDATAIQWHKMAGIAMSWACYLFLVFFKTIDEKKSLLSGTTILILILLFFVGHTGSVITHGEGFVFGPMNLGEKAVLTVDNSSAYQFAVEPVLEKKCFSCHNESKRKGKLVMTSISDFKKGGEHGPPWDPGTPAKSYLLKVIHLPLTHDDHMPPDGRAQLTESEKILLKVWIESGADFEKKVTDFNPGDSLRILAATFTPQETTQEKVYEFTAASEETVEKLNTPFRTVSPLYTGSPALRADFYIQEVFQAASLQELEAVKDQLVELNLSHMPVTDKELAVIGKFRNLETLNLNFTSISIAWGELKPLEHLRSLSLSGTKINTPEINEILTLPELKEFFGWNTPISEADQQELILQFPKIKFVWSLYHDTNILRLSKPGMANEGILKKSELVVLKHTMPGTSIRYTLDGSIPDSVNGKIYDMPFPIDKTTTIKAFACKPGWLKSDVYEIICFVAGYKPKQIELFSKVDRGYPAEGAKSLTDGKKGFADLFKEPAWMGFTNNELSAGFDLGKDTPVINYVVISYGKSTGSYIFPPAEVLIYGGPDKNSLTLIKKVNPLMPEKNEGVKNEALVIGLPAVSYAYYKIIAKPIAKLPKWHKGKGKKGWIMIDEIFFN